MRLEDLKEAGPTKIKDREAWNAKMRELGVDRVLKEVGKEEYPTGHLLYALAGSKLMGSWNIEKKEGVAYSGKGMNFDERRRKFTKEKF